jgi:short-subunit dehydrogenase
VNLRSPIHVARIASRAMARRGRGQIVFISSIAGKVSATGSSLYSATKFGLRGFSLGLRADLRSSGVGVSTVFPGFIRDAGLFAMTGVRLPRGAGTRSPQDVANAVVRAIDGNIAELDVAAFEQRLGGWLAHFFPDFVAASQRMLGADKISAQISAGQRSKR